MNIKKVLLIIIIIYLVFLHSKKNKNIENFAFSDTDKNEIKSIIKEIYNTDMDAIRTLSDFSKKISDGNNLNIPGNLTVTGTITGSLSGNASSSNYATNAGSASNANKFTATDLNINNNIWVKNKLFIGGMYPPTNSSTGLEIGLESTNMFTLWNYDNTSIRFGTNNTERMIILNNGYIGIGTSIPKYPIDIVNNEKTTISESAWWFGNKSTGVNKTGGTLATNNIKDAPISMRLNASIWIQSDNIWAGFWSSSDRRIKKNINYDISSECLNLIRKLKCSNYSYIDERENKTSVYGYIAQDVSEIIPYAVTTQTGFIPNIYSHAIISKENDSIIITCLVNKKYTLNNNHENKNLKIKLFDVNMKEFIVKIKKIIDNGVFMIKNDENINLVNKEYFVYGQEIDDFKILNNEAITVISSAAVKEIDQQQQNDKIKILELENKINEQQLIINKQEDKINKQQIIINNILERLNKLEN